LTSVAAAAAAAAAAVGGGVSLTNWIGPGGLGFAYRSARPVPPRAPADPLKRIFLHI